MTVAIGDGAGAPSSLDDGSNVLAALSDVARDVGSVRLVLGWLPSPAVGLDPEAFAEVVLLTSNGGAREVLKAKTARFVPTRLAAIPALLSGPLHPDVLVCRLVRRDGRFWFGSEVSFQRALVDAGVPVLAVLADNTPAASAEPAIDPDQVRVLGTSSAGPARQHREPDSVHEALADAVLAFVPEGARVQYGPGPLGTALLRRATVPLQIDTGLLTDAVVDLDRHGLLMGEPSAAYLVGTERLYDWADSRPILRGIEYTHDLTRLSGGGSFVAVNTAIEIDQVGQINAEGMGEKVFGGIGGHPDYCTAARMNADGLSIIAVPSTINGRSPLVEHLSRPVTTPAYDVDVIVTESGSADLREADWLQRRALIAELFGSERTG
jgi:acyl-CoA hydrolase